MNLGEFKSWFEGFTETLDGPPEPKAWARICEQVKSIVPEATPWPTIIREYVPRYPVWPTYLYPYIGPVCASQVSNNVAYSGDVTNIPNSATATAYVGATCVEDAFKFMGRCDAENLN